MGNALGYASTGYPIRRGRIGPARGAYPLSLSPLLWVIADAGTYQTSGGAAASADADPVGQWQDQSGNGRHLGQSTAAKRPLLKLNVQNGLPMLLADGVDDYLETAAFTYDQPCTIALVAKATGGSFYVDGGANLNTRNISRDGSDTQFRMHAGSSVDQTVVTQVNAFSAILVFNGASSVSRFNSTEATGNAGAGNANGLRVFTNGGVASFYLAGHIGELLVLNGAYDAGQRTTLYNYLKARWGTP